MQFFASNSHPAKIFFLGILLCLFAVNHVFSAYLENVPQTLKQPDGTIVNCFATGDEFHNWLHDANNYTIVRNPETGYLVYAIKKSVRALVSDSLIASGYIVGKSNPITLGIQPGLNLPPREIERKIAASRQMFRSSEETRAPTIGTINNLIIFIRFADQTDFDTPLANYDYSCNATTGVTMKNYFTEVSNSELTVSTTFYPVSVGTYPATYVDIHNRGYFSPYDETTNPAGYNTKIQRGAREQALLHAAVVAVSSQVPDGLDLDGDLDGKVDNVCFVIRGSPDGWGQLLWPHKWELDIFTEINGKQVWTYNFQLDDWMSTNILCHEMFHSLGSPDLYRYVDKTIVPVGPWDLMAKTSSPPQHMTVYMKRTYGNWGPPIPEITAAGTYTLFPVSQSPYSCFKFASPYTTDEYFIVEYRRKEGTFESGIEASGLLVYRINTDGPGGNEDGPPDEVYIFRPGGTNTVNGNLDDAVFASNYPRTTFDDVTDPACFLSDGSAGGYTSGLGISNVTAIGNSISFDFKGGSNAPSIFNVQHTPLEPIDADAVQVTADITDDGSITSAKLEWCTDGSSFGNPINMSNGGPGITFGIDDPIPAQLSGTTVSYRITATDNSSETTTSVVYSYTVTELSYCEASGGCDEYISRVLVGDIDNISNSCLSYHDYTDFSTDMQLESNYTITVSNGEDYSKDQCGIWVDWDQDLSFDDPSEEITVSGSPGRGPYTATITPPPGAELGNTRLRIRITYTGAVGPCGTTTYGEVEDYTINVTNTHTVTFVEGENGTITGELIQTITDGGNCTEVTAVPNDNYSFSGWTGGYTGGDNPLEITNVTSDMTITANFNLEIIKGPYLQNVTSTTMTIMWETDDFLDSRVNYGLTSPPTGQSSDYDDTPVEIHEMLLEGLTPDKTYYYSVTSDGATSPTYTFSTAPDTERSFRFAAYGDIQRVTPINDSIVKRITEHAPEIVFHTGDMVNNGKDYDEWGPQFFNKAQPLICSTAFMPARGNHEYSGPSSGQLWFEDFFSLPNNEEYYAYTYSNTRFIALNSNEDFDTANTQLAWLTAELGSSEYADATWHIVYFHHPPFTASRHVDDPDVKENLVPLFEDSGIDMVFSGHTHLYERYHHNDVYYFVIGGGGKKLDNLADDDVEPIREFGVKNYHYCIFDVNAPGLSLALAVRDTNGTRLDTITLRKHIITASAGANGSIDPDGVVKVKEGTDHTFTFTPDANYKVEDVLVDGASIGLPASHTFTNVTSSHTIAVSFTPVTYTITATANANGTIDPEGAIEVNHGDDQSFNITADTDYQIDYVEVDGVDMGAIPTHNFPYVTEPHTVVAFFEHIPTLTVTYPDGGEEFIVNSIYTIAWTSQGDITNVKIEYSSDNGVGWNSIIGTTINDGEYDWTVPYDLSVECLVRISGIGSGMPSDVSETLFSIKLKQLAIPLSDGWNMISFNMDPIDYRVDTLFKDISSLILVKNNDAEVYIPEFKINTIGLITITDGYKVYTENPEILTVEGFSFSDYTSISVPLILGWNMIAYLPEEVMPLKTALQDIDSNDISIVKNHAGDTYIPGFGINTIDTMVPGEGYKIRMKTETSFTYPLPPVTALHAQNVSVVKQTSHFTFSEKTGNNMTVIVQAAINPLINGAAIENSDEIGVFTTAGLCVGGVVWNGANIAITVWGDDNQTPEVDGIKAGDTLRLRLWDASADLEYVAAVTYTSGNSDYSVDGISVLATCESAQPVTVTVTAPNGGETARIGEIFDVTWTNTGFVGNVLIEYTYDNGTNWTTIVDGESNTGSYSWTVPPTLSATCKVRISETADGYPVDESDNVFTIDNATSIGEGGPLTVRDQFFAVPNPVDFNNNEHAVSFTLITEKKIISAGITIFDAVGNLLVSLRPVSLQVNQRSTGYALGSWNPQAANVSLGSFLAVLTFTENNSKKHLLRTMIGVRK